ncbi:unnamed protein product [Knipowitschia caucasica]|uniref:Uncharacterized protein n=1 Tax=Knipowitschia caucasica TaxID=637954 RepID=A0AAV2LD21_KNICA
MKSAVVLLCLLLVLSHGDGLRCFCGGLRICPSGGVETCSSFSELCGRVVITAGASPNYFRGCMSASTCAALDRPGISSAFCCRSDGCNR